MFQNISLRANHLPGYLNSVADRESRIAQDRWDWQLHPNIFLKINQMGTTCSRPVCIQAKGLVTSIFQLEARPSSLSYRCISSGLVRENLLCKSPMEPIVESPVRSQSPTSRCTNSGPSLERTAMVSCSIVPTVRLSSPDPSINMTHTSSGVTATTLSTPIGTVGCMAHLRGCCQAEKFSEQASELLMESWWHKSNKSFNSLFYK